MAARILYPQARLYSQLELHPESNFLDFGIFFTKWGIQPICIKDIALDRHQHWHFCDISNLTRISDLRFWTSFEEKENFKQIPTISQRKLATVCCAKTNTAERVKLHQLRYRRDRNIDTAGKHEGGNFGPSEERKYGWRIRRGSLLHFSLHIKYRYWWIVFCSVNCVRTGGRAVADLHHCWTAELLTGPVIFIDIQCSEQ